MFDADYFAQHLKLDAVRHGSPVWLTIVMVSGERYDVADFGEPRDGCVGFIINPPDGKDFPEIPEGERRPGGPSHYSEFVIVPYERIAEIRTSNNPKGRASRSGVGFAGK